MVALNDTILEIVQMQLFQFLAQYGLYFVSIIEFSKLNKNIYIEFCGTKNKPG